MRNVWTIGARSLGIISILGLVLAFSAMSRSPENQTVSPRSRAVEIPDDATLPRSTAAPGVVNSPRAIWVQYDAASTPEKADAMLDRVVNARLNTVLYSVGSGTVAYKSSLLMSFSDLPPGYDPLRYVVEQAHARGLKVQAWWSPGYAGKDSRFRDQHPEWDIAARGAQQDTHWLNFSIPAVQQFVGDVVLEIAAKYDVDGIHLDYIRYPASASDLGLVGVIADDDVANTVKSVYQRLKAVRPNVLLTAAVMDSRSRSSTYMQHWEKWLEGGYIDYVMPMAYYGPDEIAGLAIDLAEWRFLANSDRIVPGLSLADHIDPERLTPKTPDQLIGQIRLVRFGGAAGFSVFDEGQLTGEQATALRELSPYASPFRGLHQTE